MNNDDGQGTATSGDVTLTVPAKLVDTIPPDVRDDPRRRDVILMSALEIGIQAIAHAGVHLDTKVVRDEFQQLETVLHQMQDDLEKLLGQELTDDDSKLALALKTYLSDEGRLAGTVRRLCDELGDPKREGSIPGRVSALLDSHFKDADSPFQKALNASDDSSPLKGFVRDQQKKLDELKDDLTTKHTNLANSISERFDKVFAHIGYKEELAEAEDKGTRKGGSFEDDVTEFLNSITFGQDSAERVGEELIEGTQRKRGDVLVHIRQDGTEDQQIIVEAKAGGHSVTGKGGVLAELSEAMEYRQAAGGIVVVTRKHAGVRQRAFDRRGSDRIIVVVDPDDPDGGFLPLEVAYAILRERLIALKQREDKGGADFGEIEKAIIGIETALAAVLGMKSKCTAARTTIDAIRVSIDEMEDAIHEQLRLLRRQVEVG